MGRSKVSDGGFWREGEPAVSEVADRLEGNAAPSSGDVNSKERSSSRTEAGSGDSGAFWTNASRGDKAVPWLGGRGTARAPPQKASKTNDGECIVRGGFEVYDGDEGVFDQPDYFAGCAHDITSDIVLLVWRDIDALVQHSDGVGNNMGTDIPSS